MEYRFVHHWNYELGEQEHATLEAAISLTSKARHDNFLHEVGVFIAEHTGALYVLIGLLSDDNQHITTCIFLKNKKVVDNFTYPLQHTPCDSVLTQKFCYYPFNVSKNFPEDAELQELNIESYLGSIFLSEESEPIGLIALMDAKPLENPAFSEHLILVLSPAIEEELNKLKSNI
ncbi:hypothetical protein H9Q13_01070 [Pontibacter sp. JH31]|uniref:GAF domain-containing protein n=1 Tax=Pontibacter aquaedesilientis TaxID=2766980 RepID=A0ABR7XDQ9_9BACT|nr:hypothetical protein [Pontibacter aquaedesilientis]MBD1395743.1 hypothetical protein [Pontibacter aquaedesilientis]